MLLFNKLFRLSTCALVANKEEEEEEEAEATG